MADSFLLFSEVTPQLTRKEFNWFQEQLQIVYVVQGQERTDLDGIQDEQIEWTGCRAYQDMQDYDPDCGEVVGFEHEFYNTKKDRSVWFYSHEGGSLDRLAHLMRKFLKMFRPDDCWSLTYATICSKPRVGEFGGGAVFVTARKITWHNAYDDIDRHRKAFERRYARG